MEIDNELPVDREQLRDLIRRETETMTKKMVHLEINAKLDSAKNTRRGQPATGASEKKKKDSNTQQEEKTIWNNRTDKEKKAKQK